MTKLPYLVLGLSLLTAPSMAQLMGRTNAPTVAQSLGFPEHGSIELNYTSIPWGQGRWAQQLQDESARGQLRAMINQGASDQPLGSLKTSVDILIGERRVPAGSYRLAFMLDDSFKWEIVLSTDEGEVEVPLAVRPSMATRRRLALSLMAGDEDLTGLVLVAFGNQVCQLPIAMAPAEEAPASPRGILNTVCPLMEDPVVKDWVVTYKGYNIGFCCEICFEDWDELEESEREQILKVLLDGGSPAGDAVAELTVLNNPMCPLMDEPVTEGFWVDYRNVRIGMCCSDCTLEWQKLTTAQKDELLESIW